METTDAFAKVNALTQEQREHAYEQARLRIAGSKPQPTQKPELQDFLRHTESHYPQWVTVLVRVLTVFTLIVVFLPSAMRLHAVALQTNMDIDSIKHSVPSAYLAAIATVIMAEIGQTIMSLASATTQSWTQKAALTFGAIICTFIALSGNAIAMADTATSNVFAFLETFAPPILVLILASIIKAQMMDAIAAKYNARVAYGQAVTQWQNENAYMEQLWNTAYANATDTPAYATVLADALREALRNANKQSKAVLRSLTVQDWRALVLRERAAGEWWRQAEIEAQAEASRIAQEEARLHAAELRSSESGKSTGATGEVAKAKTLHEGDAWVKVCPVCNLKFEGDTHRQASNRLSAHMKRHANEARRASDEDTKPTEAIQA